MEQGQLQEGFKLAEYQIICKLGEGRFGTVYKAQNGKHQKFAIKCAHDSSDETVNQAEVKTLKHLSEHKNIVTVHDFILSQNNKYIYVVMEFCDGGDLNSYLVHHNPNLTERFHYMIDMARGVNYLHSMNVMHRDLKPQNILLAKGNERYICKISDFSMAKIRKKSGKYFTTQCGTPAFQAPEVDSGRYTYSADVFSLGVVYFAMAAGTIVTSGRDSYITPFVMIDNEQQPLTSIIRRNILDVDNFVKRHFSTCPVLGHIVCEMISLDPAKRPMMDMVLIRVSEARGRSLSTRQSAIFRSDALVQKLQELERLFSADKLQSGMGTFEDDAVDGEIHVISLTKFLTKEELADVRRDEGHIGVSGDVTRRLDSAVRKS